MYKCQGCGEVFTKDVMNCPYCSAPVAEHEDQYEFEDEQELNFDQNNDEYDRY